MLERLICWSMLLLSAASASAAPPPAYISVNVQVEDSSGKWALNEGPRPPDDAVVNIWSPSSVPDVLDVNPDMTDFLIDSGSDDWLNVKVCNGDTTAATLAAASALEALQLFQDIGINFQIYQGFCNQYSLTLYYDVDVESKKWTLDPSHWIVLTRDLATSTYSTMFGNPTPAGVVPVVAKTSVYRLKNEEHSGQVSYSSTWDIVINGVDYRGFRPGYPSQSAPSVGPYESGDTTTAKFAVDLVTHELMHVLGATHITGFGVEPQHSTMYQTYDDEPPYEIHYALEVNADMYRKDGVVHGERIVPLADQVFLFDNFPVIPPPRTVLVPWHLDLTYTNELHGSWRPWASETASFNSFLVQGIAPVEFKNKITDACALECIESAVMPDESVLRDALPGIASNYDSNSSYYYLSLADELDGNDADPCAKLSGGLSLDRTADGVIRRPTMAPVSCYETESNAFVSVDGFTASPFTGSLECADLQDMLDDGRDLDVWINYSTRLPSTVSSSSRIRMPWTIRLRRESDCIE